MPTSIRDLQCTNRQTHEDDRLPAGQPMMTSRDIPASQRRHRGSFANAFSSSAPLAQSSIETDLANHPDYDRDADADNNGQDPSSLHSLDRSTSHQPSWGYSMAASYRRPSHIGTGNTRSTVLPALLQSSDAGYLTKQEQEAVREEERSLLRDNNYIPPKHPHRRSSVASVVKSKAAGLLASLQRRGSKSVGEDEEAIGPASSSSEQTPLLAGNPDSLPYGGEVETPEELDKKWADAVEAGKIHTSWQREAKVLGRYSRSLILTYMLQYSLPVCSVFAVGHLGKIPLCGVSLGSMTANITGYAVYQGLATSLDTLCAQAYGSGHKKLVGLQMQRMVLFLWVVTLPVGVIWLSGEQILSAIVPDKETARLAGQYLRIALIGAPGYAAFESGKRFVQAQGLFTANMYVLLFVAPLNALMHWLFVWRLGWGFIGAPISVAITETLMPFLLLAYVRFVAGRECWGGFSRDAFRNWWPMIRLALPGLVMILAEFLAFETLTLVASWISPTHLAAQAVLQTLCGLVWQFPFTLSIASSTRIANLIGATLADAAKVSARVTLIAAACVGVFDMALLSGLRDYIPRLFTSDDDVAELVAAVLPLCAAFQMFDALATACNGILRGIGRQEIGGVVSLICYYGIAMPISFGTGFGLHWNLYGLWTGPAVALFLVSLVEGIFIFKADWQRSVDDATQRNTAG